MSDTVDASPVRIRAETTAGDPDACRFIVDRPVHATGTFSFDSRDQAAGSPLPAALFALPGVRFVMVSGAVVTVSKTPETSWDPLRANIGRAIRAQLHSGVPAILEAAYDPSTGRRDDATLRVVIEKLLKNEVNPSIAAHGGSISLVDITDGKLSIAMSGGCQGCASSKFTLRQGVEVMVRRVAPEIEEIIDTTDHAAGVAPFYVRSAATAP